MTNVLIFVIAVLLANVGGWAQCDCISGSVRFRVDCYGGPYAETGCYSKVTAGTTFANGDKTYCYLENGFHSDFYCSNCSYDACEIPTSQSSSSSDNSSSSVASSSSNSGPPLPPPETCTYCEDYMGWAEEESVVGAINIQVPYSRMYRCSNCTKDANGYIISAFDCQEVRNSPGTCSQNGDCPSNQICADSTGDDSPVQCIATFGSEVWMKDIKTGNTFKCSADGSCERAKQMVASGECKNPYADKNKPNSSDSNDPNSSDSNDPNSSSAENPPESSGEFCDMCDKLDRIAANTQATMNNTSDISQWTQETMNKTIDIDNHLTEMGIDVSHIRTNTDETATNTGSIDNKLNTTNSLLNDIKNKNWNPQINVNPPTVNVGGDTIIVNVGGDSLNINVDTVKAPSEILGFLKGLFGGMDTTANYDTTGWGSVNDSAKAQLDSALNKGDWVTSLGCDTTGGRKCDNSLIGAYGLDSAKSSLKATFTQLGDTLKNGAFGDSLANWSSKFTAGTISGSGSDNCPSVISRNYHIELVQGAGFDLTLGRFLCQPLVGNTTGWALCRLLLRASVALACMWFLFHCATGFSGRGGNDD